MGGGGGEGAGGTHVGGGRLEGWGVWGGGEYVCVCACVGGRVRLS
jgi:hypothetical protein